MSKFKNNNIPNNKIFNQKFLEAILDKLENEVQKDLKISKKDFEKLIAIQLAREKASENEPISQIKTRVTREEIQKLKQSINNLNKLSSSELKIEPFTAKGKTTNKELNTKTTKSVPITVELDILKILINERSLIPLLKILKTNKKLHTRELLITMGSWGYGQSLMKRATNLGLIDRKIKKDKSRGKPRIYNALTNKGREVVRLVEKTD